MNRVSKFFFTVSIVLFAILAVTIFAFTFFIDLLAHFPDWLQLFALIGAIVAAILGIVAKIFTKPPKSAAYEIIRSDFDFWKGALSIGIGAWFFWGISLIMWAGGGGGNNMPTYVPILHILALAIGVISFVGAEMRAKTDLSSAIMILKIPFIYGIFYLAALFIPEFLQ